MFRTSPIIGAIPLVLCLSLFFRIDHAAGQTGVQIHPPAGEATGAVIAVISDNFTSSQEDAFNEAAANLLLHGLLADPTFAEHKSKFTVKTFFIPTVDLGFEVNPHSNCNLSWDREATPGKIQTSAPGAFRWVVLGNHDYTIGCKSGDWAYAAVGSIGHGIIEHEFGHLIAGLLDEYVDADAKEKSHSHAMDIPKNCSKDVTNPHWKSIPGLDMANITNPDGCDHFGKDVVRPSEHCHMFSHGRTFCSVCAHFLDESFAELALDTKLADMSLTRPLPPQLANLRAATAGFFALQPSKTVAKGQAVQVLLGVTSPKGPGAATKPTIISAVDLSGPVTLRLSRVGDYVFEVFEGTTTLALGVVTGDPFEVRDYRGGGQHRRAEAPFATITVVIPGETRKGLVDGSRNVQIAVYRLPPQKPTDPKRIDSDNWFRMQKDNKQAVPVAQVEPQFLKERLLQILATK